MAAALLGARLSWPQGVGGVLIGLGLWLVNRPRAQTLAVSG